MHWFAKWSLLLFFIAPLLSFVNAVPKMVAAGLNSQTKDVAGLAIFFYLVLSLWVSAVCLYAFRSL